MDQEFSAGGIVVDQEKLLMIRVRNLEGKVVWTFPKGHLEEGETAEETARREVHEETGWESRIVRPLERVEYFFQRDGKPVKKQVDWFLMEPVRKSGEPDAEEVLEAVWVHFLEAKRRISYRSDKKLLQALKP